MLYDNYLSCTFMNFNGTINQLFSESVSVWYIYCNYVFPTRRSIYHIIFFHDLNVI